jgi:hypothetical protein
MRLLVVEDEKDLNEIITNSLGSTVLLWTRASTADRLMSIFP